MTGKKHSAISNWALCAHTKLRSFLWFHLLHIHCWQSFFSFYAPEAFLISSQLVWIPRPVSWEHPDNPSGIRISLHILMALGKVNMAFIHWTRLLQTLLYQTSTEGHVKVHSSSWIEMFHSLLSTCLQQPHGQLKWGGLFFRVIFYLIKSREQQISMTPIPQETQTLKE